MPRANRYYIPGYTWHITHRCHKKDFLLKFERDRQRYERWLFEAKKRYNLSILNYTVTSNHVHLLVVDTDGQVIPKSMQLIAGRTAQAYNDRKKRKGAFWEDRYHATAVQTRDHLFRCMHYIDCNMVRAGVVQHPSAWAQGGYHEIINPPKRYACIDQNALLVQLGMQDHAELRTCYQEALETKLSEMQLEREALWTESLAVGDECYVQEVKSHLSGRAMHRASQEHTSGVFALREPDAAYNQLFDPQKALLSPKNTVKWQI